MKLLKRYISSVGNMIEFYSLPHKDVNKIVVIDLTSNRSRHYKLGTRDIITIDDYTKLPKARTIVTSFDQVIEAWTSEAIHF